jgi:hypothetical protein
MGFLAPALPWIAKGASLLGGWLGGKKAQSSAQQRSPEELAALNSATSAGNTLVQQGQQFNRLGLPAVQSSMGYWDTLLRGSRSAMAGATAGARGAITDQYRGAANNLERSTLQGAQRGQAQEELNRDRVAKIAGLTSGVQPGAADALSKQGDSLLSMGGQQLNAAGGLFQNLLGEGFANRKYARQEGEKAGSGIGSLLFDVLSGFGGKNSGVSGGLYKSPSFGTPTDYIGG